MIWKVFVTKISWLLRLLPLTTVVLLLLLLLAKPSVQVVITASCLHTLLLTSVAIHPPIHTPLRFLIQLIQFSHLFLMATLWNVMNYQTTCHRQLQLIIAMTMFLLNMLNKLFPVNRLW